MEQLICRKCQTAWRQEALAGYTRRKRLMHRGRSSRFRQPPKGDGALIAFFMGERKMTSKKPTIIAQDETDVFANAVGTITISQRNRDGETSNVVISPRYVEEIIDALRLAWTEAEKASEDE